MRKAVIDKEKCKGCRLCVGVCPKKIIAIAKKGLNSKGFFPARLTDEKLCIGCAFCAIMCPDTAIEVIDEV
ncbi:MAG: 4Fe-4S binding protein [Clostridiales bacterium]|nr:4Fe-4S binding protein [Clostridiales bacterium]